MNRLIANNSGKFTGFTKLVLLIVAAVAGSAELLALDINLYYHDNSSSQRALGYLWSSDNGVNWHYTHIGDKNAGTEDFVPISANQNWRYKLRWGTANSNPATGQMYLDSGREVWIVPAGGGNSPTFRILPTVTVSAFVSSTTEGSYATTPGRFRIQRVGSMGGYLTVNYTTATAVTGSTAQGPSPSADYELYDGSGNVHQTSIDIPPGSYVDVQVWAWNDGVSELAETVIMHLQSSSSYALGATTQATVTILQN